MGLAVYVCWRYRAWFTCAAVAAAMVVEVVSIKNNLAGKEHVAAVLAVLVALRAAGAVAAARSRGTPSGRQRLGAPPMNCSTLRRSPDQRRS